MSDMQYPRAGGELTDGIAALSKYRWYLRRDNLSIFHFVLATNSSSLDLWLYNICMLES